MDDVPGTIQQLRSSITSGVLSMCCTSMYSLNREGVNALAKFDENRGSVELGMSGMNPGAFRLGRFDYFMRGKIEGICREGRGDACDHGLDNIEARHKKQRKTPAR